LWLAQGLAPEIVPSIFAEDLSPASYEDIHEYPVATATHKAVEVYERLVVRFHLVYIFLPYRLLK
jgi:septum formation protein